MNRAQFKNLNRGYRVLSSRAQADEDSDAYDRLQKLPKCVKCWYEKDSYGYDILDLWKRMKPRLGQHGFKRADLITHFRWMMRRNAAMSGRIVNMGSSPCYWVHTKYWQDKMDEMFGPQDWSK